MAGSTDAAAAADAAPAAVVATIDPCDPKRMMFDSLDLLAYEIITNPSKRMERKGQLEVRHMCQTCGCMVMLRIMCTVFGWRMS